MKKRILLVAAVFISAVTFAQDLTSKKGEVILPEAGDWAIGFDAAPFLDYAGNLFNSGNSSPTANFLTGPDSAGNGGMRIYGKYFADAQTAYRVRLRLGFGSTTITNLVPDVTDPVDQVEDEIKVSGNNIGLGFGLEKRRGSTRLQGIYGGEVLIALSGGKTEYTYGNDIDDLGAGASRVTEVVRGSGFDLGVRGFIGAEYFIFPKISVAAEYGWGLALSSVGEGETTVESFDGTDDDTTTQKTGTSSSFGIDTDNNGGQLRITFHF